MEIIRGAKETPYNAVPISKSREVTRVPLKEVVPEHGGRDKEFMRFTEDVSKG